tara:strand:+ start:17 stop:520 length:504 start_codon:yes stop_codon:yes gene_type:complete
MAYSLIKLTPTTAAATMGTGDVLFDSTEVVLPAHACKLVSVTIVDYEKKLLADDIAVLFHHDNAGGTFGTSGAAEALSVANAVLNQPIAVVRCNSESEGQFANFGIISNKFDTSDAADQSGPVILSKDKSDDKLFVMARIMAVSTTGTMAGTNADGGDLAVYLGFEY